MAPEKFVGEFKRISNRFNAASWELNRTGNWRIFKTKRLFREMKHANQEMEMLGAKAKAHALQPK